MAAHGQSKFERWAHAQFVRLAWSIDAGRPVEPHEVVAGGSG